VILSQLPTADGAPFNAFRRDYERYCLPDTRVELLKEIKTWGDAIDEPSIFLLNGMAGTGKSTISRTVARHFEEQRRLGASFFFSPGQGDLGHAEKFFTTIASQMAHALPALKRHICEALEEDYRIDKQGLIEQWRKLIFRPLSKLENLPTHHLPIILVIDALDECEREDRKDDVRVILRLLAEAKDLPKIRLKIFLTSRPEVAINEEFSVSSRLVRRDFVLHHISNDIIEHDIRIFVEYEFERIREKHGLLSDWPKAKEISSILHDAKGLFIYAATICRFVDRRHPEKQLSIILQCIGSNPPTPRLSLTGSLDVMYSQILKASIYKNYDEEEREEQLDLFRRVVGSIAILLDTLPTNALASLVDLPTRDMDDILKEVQAVLDVPDSIDMPIRMLHPSFRDFLLNKKRCSDLNFWIDERQAHHKLLDHCIRLLSKSLRQDVCRQGAPGAVVASVEGSQIEQYLPREVRYACLYWVQHLQRSSVQLRDNDHIHQFLQVHLLHWLEALGWMRKASEGILAILSLEAQISVSFI
jgi:NACHT domain